MTTGLNLKNLDSVFTNYQVPSGKAAPTKLGDLDLTPFRIFKAIFTPSYTLSLATAGGVLGYFTGNSIGTAAAGAATGIVCDFAPKAADLIPEDVKEDVKELATNISNMGLFTLGIYASYECLPDSVIQGAIEILPNALTNLPSDLKTIPVVNMIIPVAQGTATIFGFTDFNKLIGAAFTSAVSIEAIKFAGRTPLFQPFANLVNEHSKKPSEFAETAFGVSLAAAAIFYSTQNTSTPELSSFFSQVYSLLSTALAGTILGTTFLASTALNYSDQPSDNLEEWKGTLEKALTTIKDQARKLSPALQESVVSSFVDTEKKTRTSIVAEVDAGINGLKSHLNKRNNDGCLPTEKEQLLIQAAILEALNLKILELEKFLLRMARFPKDKKPQNEINTLRTQMKATLEEKSALLNKQKDFMDRIHVKELDQLKTDLTTSINYTDAEIVKYT